MSGTVGRKQKLELTWVGKEDRPRLEPRILIEEPALSHSAARRREGDIFDNMLIYGDNLLALKSLEADYVGKVKCVFIDPPYNTGSAFAHYDDGVEHSLWLTMMRDRLEMIHRLLAGNGSLWVTLDDNEAHYFKVMCDEVFGRNNFVSDIIWQKVYSIKGSAKHISDMHDHVLVYAKNIDSLELELIPRTDSNNKLYKNPDNDPRGAWRPGPLAARNYYGLGTYPITCPSGRIIPGPPSGSYWRFSKEKFLALDMQGLIWWGKDGNNVPAPKLYLDKVSNGTKPTTFWKHDEVGNNQDAKREIISLFGEEIFSTPKPERLLERVIQLSTKSGELVLDSFAGSGTTGAVAHKMGRRWIMIELGDHARTHIAPRLRKVIDGEDKGGVTEATGWQGGGGFRFFRLAPSLLAKDRWGNWVISDSYNPAMLAEAMCKHMGFTYAPSQDPLEYWRHGHSSERDFIFVTTHALTHKMLEAISYDIGPDRHLLICCKAFSTARADAFANLTLTKIPHAILSTCEWGRDDYSLRVATLPAAGAEPRPAEEPGEASPKGATRGRRAAADRPTLFDAPAEAED